MRADSILQFLGRWLLLLLAVGLATQAQASKQVKGWLERVRIMEPELDVSIRAKLDTGAKSSSLHASNIEYFEKDGKPWVRFDFTWIKPNVDIERIKLEYPIKDRVLIRRHAIDPHNRPVVEMRICIGDEIRKIDVNLINRSRLNYPMLIGREVLKGKYLIDSEETFTTKPKCEHKDKS